MTADTAGLAADDAHPVTPATGEPGRAAVLRARLAAPLPVTAQGVAAATVPLTSAASPVYARHSRDALSRLLDDAIV